VHACLEEIRRRCRKRCAHYDQNEAERSDFLLDSSVRVRIDSWNNFPTAAGLASSAAGYACLVYALAKAYRVEGEISDIARRGSGSACRSIYGGFVEWDPGFDAAPSIAKQIFPHSHWPELRACIVVVSDQQKSTPSSEGMKRSVATSTLLRHRADTVVPARLEALRSAISTRNFDDFAEITMKESNSLHAACLDTFPPLSYLNESSHNIIYLVHAVNSHLGRTVLCYTFDAGPNAFLFFRAADAAGVRSLLCRAFELDLHDSELVRGMKPEENDSSKEWTAEQEKEILIKSEAGRLAHLRGRAKFLIFTQAGPGPEVLSES